MNFNKLIESKLFVFILFLVLVLSLKSPIINMPYVRDPFGVYVAPSIWVKDHHFNPFYGNDKSTSHPPLFFELLALAFSIFGVHLWVGHITILVSAVFILYYTYLIGSHLYRPKVGLIAALLLLFSPLFFAQIGMVMLDVFLAMIAVITIYYALQKRLFPYLLAGNLLVLTKVPGIIIIGAIVLYKLFFEREKIKGLIVYSSPAFTFLLWLCLSKWVYGWFFFPDYVNLFGLEIFLKEVLYRIDQVFITNYKIILTSFVFLLLIKSEKKFRLRSATALGICVSAISYLICRYIANILFLIEKVFKIGLVDLLQINLHGLYSFRYVIPFLVLTIFLIPNIIKSKDVLSKSLKKEVWLLLLCIFSTILFFSFISGGYQQRYMLMAYPLFFIISSKAMISIFKNKNLYIIVAVILIALFITKWWGNVYPLCGPCEENLEYLSVIKTHQDMARFIESNYPDSIILTECPQTEELTLPWGGYVKKGIRIIEVEKHDILRLGINDYKIPPPDKFDLVYYSIGGIDSKELEEAVNLYNLTLIKKFEKNGKIALLYGKNE